MYKKLRGFNDWFKKDGEILHQTSQKILDHFKQRGYGYVALPIIEDLALFKRTVGTNTDIINKEMFYIKTKKPNRTWILRPESTAQIARMFIENNLFTDISQHSQKFCYLEPMFRYERPQHNRYRQFYSFGVEYYYQPKYIDRLYAINELINDIVLLFQSHTEIVFIYNWLPENISNYQKDLKDFFLKRKEGLCNDCLKRLDKNVLRILDCKIHNCSSHGRKDIPRATDYLSDKEQRIFKKTKQFLKNSKNVEYIYDPFLVRGLDYYNGFVFEIIIKNNGILNKKSCLGGGEYNSLLKDMGLTGEKYIWNSLGLGIGIERLLNIFPESRGDKLLLVSKSNSISLLKIRELLITKGYNVTVRFSTKNIGRSIEWAKKNGFSYILDNDKPAKKENRIAYKIIHLDDFIEKELIYVR